MSRELKPCGTVAAYHRHLRHNETPCDACRQARSEYHRAHYEPSPLVLQPCGTRAGNERHRRRGEASCDPCRLAYNAYQRELMSRPRTKPRDEAPAKCGTIAGYQQHRRYQEPPCDACKEARRVCSQEWRDAHRPDGGAS